MPASMLGFLVNLYQPPPPSPYSQSFTTFIDPLSSFLTHLSTTPHEFILTGDFNIHLDDPTDQQSIFFLSLLAGLNLFQSIFILTHTHVHTLDLVITSASTSLNLIICHAVNTTSDHFQFSLDVISPRTFPLLQPRLLSIK